MKYGLRPEHIGSMASAPANTTIPMLAAASAGMGIAHLGTSTMPYQIGALMQGDKFSATGAGSFGFFEVGAVALTMIAVSPVVHRVRASHVAVIGAVIASLANIGIYLVGANLLGTYALAVGAGCGFGLVFAASVSSVAACKRPDRLYAVSNSGAILIVVGLMSVLPFLSSMFGPTGPFVGICMLLAAAIPFFFGFTRQNALRSGKHAGESFRRREVQALLLLWAFPSVGVAAVWCFAERIGHDLALNPVTVGLVLSGSTLFGLAGTSLAAALAGRLPRTLALGIGLIGAACSCALIGCAHGLTSYAVGTLSYWLFTMFLYCFFQGTAAAMDRTGQAGTAGSGLERMAYAISAPFGGIVVDHLSYTALGLFGAATCLILLPVCLPVIHRAVAETELEDGTLRA